MSWKYWTMMDYGKIKKCPDEIRCLDWITLIDRYWLVINDWLANIDWPDHLTCSSYSERRETPWEDLVNKGSKNLRTQQYLLPFIGDNELKCINFWWLSHDYPSYFLSTWVLISFMWMWMNIGDQRLFQQPPYSLLL